MPCRKRNALRSYRLADMFTDVEIVISGNHPFRAHKLILSACSPFFETLFRGSKWIECQRGVVEMTGNKNPEIMTAVLDYMYTDDLKVKQKYLVKTLQLADFLLMDDLKTCCESRLVNCLTIENCLLLKDVSIKYSLDWLNEAASGLLFIRMSKILTKARFNLLLHDEEQLLEIFTNSNLIVWNEDDVLRFLIDWVKFNPDKRNMEEVFDCVRVSGLSDNCLKSTVENSENSLVSKKCKQLLQKEIIYRWWKGPTKQPDTSERLAPRCVDVIIAYDSANYFRGYVVSENRWFYIPDPSDHNFIAGHAARYKNMIIVFSGRDNYNTVYYYDSATNRWFDFPNTIESHDRGAAIACGEVLYVMGGYEHEKIVEKYDPRIGKWTREQDSIYHHKDFKLVLVRDRYIYALESHEGVERLDTYLGIWQECPEHAATIIFRDIWHYAMTNSEDVIRMTGLEEKDLVMYENRHEIEHSAFEPSVFLRRGCKRKKRWYHRLSSCRYYKGSFLVTQTSRKIHSAMIIEHSGRVREFPDFCKKIRPIKWCMHDVAPYDITRGSRYFRHMCYVEDHFVD